MKHLFKTAIAILLVLLAVWAVQFEAYRRVLKATASEGPADAIVVFTGSDYRLERGYSLAVQARAPFLIISPADEARLARLMRKYAPQPQFSHLVEPAARTTFENTMLTAALIRKHGITSVLLVTDRFHMPRSYFLLRIALARSGVEVLPSPVEGQRFAALPTRWSTVQMKQVHNEMVEFWGSLLEMARYAWSGELPGDDSQEKALITFLRSVLLFRV